MALKRQLQQEMDKNKKLEKDLEQKEVDKSKQEIFDTKGLRMIPKGEIENE